MNPDEINRRLVNRSITGASALADDRLTLYLDDGTFLIITAQLPQYPYEHAQLEYHVVDPLEAP